MRINRMSPERKMRIDRMSPERKMMMRLAAEEEKIIREELRVKQRKEMMELAEKEEMLIPEIFKDKKITFYEIFSFDSRVAPEEDVLFNKEIIEEFEIQYRPKKIKAVRIKKPHITNTSVGNVLIESGWLIKCPGNKILHMTDDFFNEWFEQRSL